MSTNVFLQDHIRRGKKLRCAQYNGCVEPQYDMVDEQRHTHTVQILPARPLHEEEEYAGRDENDF